jgi:predicted GH43/DUF377 family glycosyl hydrolase
MNKILDQNGVNKNLLAVPSDVTPSCNDYKVEGVFNPGVIEKDNEVHLLLRVAERPVEKRLGFVPLPRYQPGKGMVIDWLRQEEVSILNSRAVLIKENGQHRFTTISHLRHAISRDGLHIDKIAEIPALAPELFYEEFGVEDARISEINGCYYLTYVAVSRYGIATALASTKNFQTFERHGIIFPPENKDVVIFPEKIGEYYYALHRPYGATPLGIPQIWLSRSSDLINWGTHQLLERKTARTRFKRFGAGPPPLKLNEGWLVIYHAVESTTLKQSPGKYLLHAMLLDLNNPSKVLVENNEYRLPSVDLGWATQDFKDVIFPTGIIYKDHHIFVYCGEADTYTAVLMLNVKRILKSLHKL